MGIIIFAFLGVFLLITSAGLLLFYREAMMKRLAAVVSPNREQGNVLDRLGRVRAGSSMGALVQPFERVVPRSAEETSIVQKRLIRAGYRQDTHLKLFFHYCCLLVLTPLHWCLH